MNNSGYCPLKGANCDHLFECSGCEDFEQEVQCGGCGERYKRGEGPTCQCLEMAMAAEPELS